MTAHRSLDREKYRKLIARVLPVYIETEEENERMLGEIEKLMAKGEKRSPEETNLLKMMVRLVEEYEAEAYPFDPAEPHIILGHLLESNNMTQSDLVPIFGSKGIVSETLAGKRGISKEKAKALAKKFKISVEVFI
jgi:HTH-type transcriptional regulator/antitoxin HigA